MTEMKSRRELGLMVTGGVIAAGLVAGAKPALADRQPEMERAKNALYDAIQSLRAASEDKGGHRVKAIQLIESAIGEVDAGIHFANTH
jgi:hypothetical protein